MHLRPKDEVDLRLHPDQPAGPSRRAISAVDPRGLKYFFPCVLLTRITADGAGQILSRVYFHQRDMTPEYKAEKEASVSLLGGGGIWEINHVTLVAPVRTSAAYHPSIRCGLTLAY